MTHITITETTEKTSEIINRMRAKFQVSSDYSDEQLDEQFPAPKEITTRHFLDSQEPDEKTLGKSANEADSERKGITLRERLLLELAYFEKYEKHLDVESWTICSGSRFADGSVPRVRLGGGRVCVDWDSPDRSGARGGLRSAITLNPSSSLSLNEAIEICKSAGLKVVRTKTVEEVL